MAELSKRYAAMFESLKQQNKMAYIPFVVACDPDIETSEQIISTLIASGADALEIGFPFSDPVADGPEIQQANTRALANNATIQDCFALLARVRNQHSEIPIGLLVYANLVMAQGIESFYQQAQQVGIDSVLIGDCPVQERQTFEAAATKHGIQTVYIAPPDADQKTIAQVARSSQGYTYLLGRKGVTGTESEVTDAPSEVINALRANHSAPLVQGFGISRPEHVAAARQAGVDGVITGSAVVRLISQGVGENHELDDLLSAVSKYAQLIANAAHG